LRKTDCYGPRNHLAPIDTDASKVERSTLRPRTIPASYAGRSDGEADRANDGNSRRWPSTIAWATSTSLWPLCWEWDGKLTSAAGPRYPRAKARA
jgi:hypothetical protein